MRQQKNIVVTILESIATGAITFLVAQYMLSGLADVIVGTTLVLGTNLAGSIMTNLFLPAVIAGVVVGVLMLFRK